MDLSSIIPVERDDLMFMKLIDSSPVVIESHKLIFFPIPKVADTLWLMLLRRMMGLHNWNSLDADSYDGLVRLSDFTYARATAMMNSPEYTRATFVRDPKDRFLAAFVDKVMSTDASVEYWCCPEGEKCLADYQTLRGFVSLIQICDNQHWTPMSSWIGAKFVPALNFIGHLETAEVDAKALLEKIGAWESFGASGWGEHGNETMFATNDKQLTDRTAPDSSGSWNLMSKLFTLRMESTVEIFYEADYGIQEFGLELKKIQYPAEKSRSLRVNQPTLKKVHIIIFETDETVEHQQNSSLAYFLQTSQKASKKAPIETTTLGIGSHFGGWGDKYWYIRETLKNMTDDTLIVVSDSRDVLLNVPDNDVAASVVSHFVSTYLRMTQSQGDAVVMSAECQCCVSAMSQASPLDYFDPTSGNRIGRACASGDDTCPYESGVNINTWKTFMSELAYKRTGHYHGSAYLNAGLFTGTARNIIRLLDRVQIGQTEDDQAVMSGLLYHDPDALLLDYENELFGVAEWPKGLERGCVFFKDIESVLIHNVTKTSPLIIHTPGKFYGCLDHLIEVLGGVSQRRYIKATK